MLLVLFMPFFCACLFFLFPLKYPLPSECDYTFRKTPWWHLYYIHRYLFAIKNASKGSGIKEHLLSINFDYSNGPEKKQLKEHDPREIITISSVGDMMTRPDLTIDSPPTLWQYIGKELFSADLSIGNLEFAVNPNRLIQTLLRYSVSPEYAKPFLGNPDYGNFSCLTLGNNHINDTSSESIISTIKYLNQCRIKNVGANCLKEDQDVFPIFSIKGVKIAVLSYSFSTNGLPLEKDFQHGVNLVRFNALKEKDYDPEIIHRHIKIAKDKGVDYIISCNHWGCEYEYYPRPYIVKRARALIEAGVDCIIGNHSHVVKPLERYQAKDGREGLICYSLGNTTNYAIKGAIKRLGQMVTITLGKKSTHISGNPRLVPLSVKVKPFVYLRRKEKQTNQTAHYLVPLFEGGRNSIQNNPSLIKTLKEEKLFRRLEKEYRKYFMQKGITYE